AQPPPVRRLRGAARPRGRVAAGARRVGGLRRGGARLRPEARGEVHRGLSAGLRIRDAEPADVELIFSLIVELADYERARERVVGTPELLSESLFGHDRVAEAVIAETDGETAGFALWFRTFSTWLCRPGLWLEDL